MTYYPCILIPKAELEANGIKNVTFTMGKLDNPALREIIEDYIGRPVVQIRDSTRFDDIIMVLIADGHVQHNRISGKRTVCLYGNEDTLKVILTDIIAERDTEKPYDVFCSYAYQTDIVAQFHLDEWVKKTYTK